MKQLDADQNSGNDINYIRPAAFLLLGFSAVLPFIYLVPENSKLIIIIGAFFCYFLYLIFRNFIYRNHLRSIGYDWVSYKDAKYLHKHLKKEVWQIPPRDDFASVPEFRDTAKTLENVFLRGMGRYPDINDDEMTQILPEAKAFLLEFGDQFEDKQFTRFEKFLLSTRLFWIRIILYGSLGSLAGIDNPLPFLILFVIVLVLGYFEDLSIQLTRKKLLELNYKKLTNFQCNKLLNNFRKQIPKIPSRQELNEIIDLEDKNEYEMLCCTLYTAKILVPTSAEKQKFAAKKEKELPPWPP